MMQHFGSAHYAMLHTMVTRIVCFAKPMLGADAFGAVLLLDWIVWREQMYTVNRFSWDISKSRACVCDGLKLSHCHTSLSCSCSLWILRATFDLDLDSSNCFIRSKNSVSLNFLLLELLVAAAHSLCFSDLSSWFFWSFWIAWFKK